MSYKTPKFVVFLNLGPDNGFDDDFLAAKFAAPLGTPWAVSSVKMSVQDLGLPVLGDVSCQIVRRHDPSDPAVQMSSIKVRTQVPMSHLVRSIDEDLRHGWELLSVERSLRSDVPSGSESVPDMESVLDKVASAGKLPPGNIDLNLLPESSHRQLKTLSEARLARALELLAYAVHFGKTHPGGACCDLDDPRGPVFLGGVLPSTRGSKMLIEAAGHISKVKILTLSPYHVLAVKGFDPAGRCVNFSVVCPKTAHRMSSRALPLTAALAAVLAVLKCMPQA